MFKIIDCEKDCPKGHRKINWFTDVELDAQCMNCYKEQLEAADREIEFINAIIGGKDKHIAKKRIHSHRLEISEKANREWARRYRAMCDEYKTAYREDAEEFTAKQDAEISRLQQVIVAIKCADKTIIQKERDDIAQFVESSEGGNDRHLAMRICNEEYKRRTKC